MQGIGDLPVELLIIITDQISRKDALNLRLCAPRNILPFIDTIVFREIYLPIDASDDLERRQLENEKEGVALQRLIDISQSRIVKLVRVLVLKVARPYSLVGAFGIFLLPFFCYLAYWCVRRQEIRHTKKGSTIPALIQKGSTITAHHSRIGLASTSDGFYTISETSETETSKT